MITIRHKTSDYKQVYCYAFKKNIKLRHNKRLFMDKETRELVVIENQDLDLNSAKFEEHYRGHSVAEAFKHYDSITLKGSK